MDKNAIKEGSWGGYTRVIEYKAVGETRAERWHAKYGPNATVCDVDWWSLVGGA